MKPHTTSDDALIATDEPTVLVNLEDLSGVALDWAVSVCEGRKPLRDLAVDTKPDGVLPYCFDLFHDIKLRSEIDDILAGEPHCSGLGSQELRAFAAEMGYIIDGPVYPPYSRDWAIGGPIIDRLGISITQCGGAWKASTTYQSAVIGPTHLIAAMRCHVGRKMGIGVGSRMGMQIHVPASLLQAK